MPLVSHLTSCTPTKSDFYLANSLAAAESEPALFRLLTFHIPNLMSLFHCLSHTRVSFQVQSLLCERFITGYDFTVRNCSTLSNFQAGRPPLVGCPRLIIQYIRSYPPYWRLFLRAQPKNVPRHSDRDPLIMVHVNT